MWPRGDDQTDAGLAASKIRELVLWEVENRGGAGWLNSPPLPDEVQQALRNAPRPPQPPDRSR